jgi:hypothetical protein
VVLPRELLYEIASKNPLEPEALASVLEEYPQRMEKFGAEILGVLVKTEQRKQRAPMRRRRKQRAPASLPANGG